MTLKNVRQPNATQLCWRGLCLGAFIFTTAFQAFSQQTPRLQDWGSLIEAVNSAAPTSPSQLVDTPEAILLRERVILVYEKGDMAELSAVMRAHPPKERAGQVIAQSLAVSVKYSIVRIDDLVRIFMASLAWPDDRFDDVPRGQLSSNGVRSRLGTDIVGLLTEKGLAADPTNHLKSSQPAKWLQGHLNAARGKFGPEVDAALERALKVIDETPQALRNPVLPGQPIKQPQADPTPVGIDTSQSFSMQVTDKKTSLPEKNATSGKVSTWMVIPTALASLVLLWLLLKRGK